MLTKVLVIVGSSVGIVLAMFIWGKFLDRDSADKENGSRPKGETPTPPRP